MAFYLINDNISTMKLTDERKKELEDIYQNFLHDEKILKMKEIPMHRGSNCYLHSFRVAKLSIKRALRHKEVDLLVILLGAILHDYYLYDWRTDREKLKHHMSNHPKQAVENAIKDFNISPEVQRVIRTHMWPGNFRDWPNTTEARIVSNADKAVCIKEASCSKGHKEKRYEEYYLEIDKLFD